MVFKAIYTQTVRLTIVTNMAGVGAITGEGEYPYNTYVDVSAKPKQGYEFIGWYYEGTLLSNTQDYKYMMWDQDVILEARFQLDSFAMNIYSNSEDHGLVLLKSNLNNDYLPDYSEQRKYTSEVTIAAYSKTDVRFLGWYDENNQLVTTNAVYTFMMPNHDYTLEAKWNYFKINYELNGGTNNENNADSFTIDDNEVILFNPKRDDKEFAGWKYNGEFIDKVDSLIINSGREITLEAVWSNYTYKIEEDNIGNKYICIIGCDDSAQKIIIPNTINIDGENIPIKEIASFAFEHNNNLVSITIPRNVTKIGTNAFNGCTNLTIYCELSSKPDGWSSYWNSSERPVYWHASGCTNDGFVYLFCDIDSSTNKFLMITSYKGDSKDIVIPSFINFDGENFTVKQIGDSAFYDNRNITSLTIPSTILKIGDKAFFLCTELTTVKFCEESQLISIGYYAFGQCDMLKSITIPNSVINIGEHAFSSCTELSTINFDTNSQLTSIGKGAFYDCSSLTSIIFPASVTTIGELAFNCCYNLSNVEFEPNSELNNIGDSAFYKCHSLTSIIIPDKVISIGDEAFYDCDSLITIFIPNSVTTIGYSAFITLAPKPIIYCETSSKPIGWDSYWSPGNERIVWSYAGFNGNYNGFLYAVSQKSDGGKYVVITGYDGIATELVIPETINVHGEEIPVKEICTSALGGANINSVFIPDCVTHINDYNFISNDALIIYCEATEQPIEWISDWNGHGNTPVVWGYLGHGTTDKGMKYGLSLDSNGNKYITITGYSGDETEVVIPETVNVDGDEIPVRTIGNSAFIENDKITCVSIPDTVTTIGNSAFRYCNSLASVSFAENSRLTSIGNDSFNSCSSLTSILIPESVMTIGDNAFYYCTSLMSVSFGKNSQLNSVGNDAFGNCGSLKSIIIPCSVTKMGSYVFTYSNSLEIYCEVTSKPSGWSSNWTDSRNTVVWGYLGRGITDKGMKYGLSLDSNGNKYITITGYSGLDTEVVIPESINVDGEEIPVRIIGNTSFVGNDKITHVSIPDTVTAIGNSAFYDCDSLTSISITENSQLVSIGSSAFYDCDSLTSISITENSQLVSIGSSAFYGCDSLASIIIPDTVTTIGSSAFGSCDSLTSIIIPLSVTKIGSSIFRDCPHLLIIYCEASYKPDGWSSYWNYDNLTVVWGYKTEK